jgi:PilZ domain
MTRLDPEKWRMNTPEFPNDPKRNERRREERVDVAYPAEVITEDDRHFSFLSRDLSSSGIRLVGTQRLLGHRVCVVLSRPNAAPLSLLVRILWTCPVGEDLVENGGAFLQSSTKAGGLPRPEKPDDSLRNPPDPGK